VTRRWKVALVAGAVAIVGLGVASVPVFRWARTGGAGSPCGDGGRFILHGSNLRDTAQWLTWTPAAEAKMDFIHAADHCRRLGMRLPEAGEVNDLLKRIEAKEARDKLDGCVFLRTEAGTTWTATQSRVGFSFGDMPHDREGYHQGFYVSPLGEYVGIWDEDEKEPLLVRCVKWLPP